MYEIYCILRDEKGVTDYAVAKDTGINPVTFADWKKGKSAPKTEKLLLIADQYTMKMGGWRTDNVMKRHYRQTLTDVEKQAQAKLDAHALKLIKGSAGHETGHELTTKKEAGPVHRSRSSKWPDMVRMRYSAEARREDKTIITYFCY